MKNTVRAHECVLLHSWQSTEVLELRPVAPGGRCVGFPPPFSCAEVPIAPSLGKRDPRGVGGPGDRGHLLSWPWWLVCRETQLSESSSRDAHAAVGRIEVKMRCEWEGLSGGTRVGGCVCMAMGYGTQVGMVVCAQPVCVALAWGRGFFPSSRSNHGLTLSLLLLEQCLS